MTLTKKGPREQRPRRAKKRRMVGLAEACHDYLDIGISKGYELIKNDEFPVPVHRIGGVWRIAVADLEELTGPDK